MIGYTEYVRKLDKLENLERTRDSLYQNMCVFAAREDNPVLQFNLTKPTSMNEEFEKARKKREEICGEIDATERELGRISIEVTQAFSKKFPKKVFANLGGVDVIAVNELRKAAGERKYKRAIVATKLKYMELDGRVNRYSQEQKAGESLEDFERMMRKNNNNFGGREI